MKKPRTVRFEVRLTEEEAAVFQDRAAREGLSKGDMFRQLLRTIWFKSGEDSAPYACFKRGWLLGASGQPEIAAIGTSEPAHREAYQEGFAEGQKAFVNAMYHRFKREQR